MLRNVAILILAVSVGVVDAEDHKLKATKDAPKGLSPAITKVIGKQGYEISSPKGSVVKLWLLKNIALKAGFKPNFTQMYPFSSGQLLGAMVIPKGAEYTDFRGQKMKPGTYTLRYGLQPMDGNHVGTSETYDFLLALPAKVDVKTDPIKTFEQLSEISAKAAGSAHPAIFSLLDPKEAEKKAKLEQDDFTQHWILSFVAKGKEKDKSVDYKVRLVVVGQSEG